MGFRAYIGANALAHAVTTVESIIGIRNPIPATGGAAPESIEAVRQNAPQAFRTLQRAVTPEEGEEIRILNNTIIEALQGVHIGQSRRDQPPEERLRSTMVSIEGNTIYSRITPAINREAYGIFVGNCDSLSVCNNVLRREALQSTGHLVFDGIRIVGQMGRRVIARQNDTGGVPFWCVRRSHVVAGDPIMVGGG